MHKEIESMSDHELLQELVRQGRRNERESNIKTAVIAALLLVIIILALVYIPKIMAPIRQLNENMDQIKQTMGRLQEFADSLGSDTAEKLRRTIDGLNETTEQAKEMFAKLNDSGLENFKTTLDDLNLALSKILQFFRR